MNKTFVNMGPPRSGTTSLWYVLRQHPEIQITHPKEKEIFIEKYGMVKNHDEYMDYFESQTINKKIFLDASVLLYRVKWLSKLINSMAFERNVYIYIKREQEEWHNSQVAYLKSVGFENAETLGRWYTHEHILHMLRKAYDEILIIDFKKLDECQSIIYDFLDIEQMNFEFPHLNSDEYVRKKYERNADNKYRR